MKYKHLFYIIATTLLMVGVFFVGIYYQKKSFPTPQFETFKDDSLGVYRLVATDTYCSDNNKLVMYISYIQMGESDSFYQLKLSTEKEPYYGHIVYSNDGIETGNFGSPERLTPIKFYNGDDSTYIIIDNKKITLTLISQE